MRIIYRKIHSKKCGYLEISAQNFAIFMHVFRIFGLLNRAHNHDCLANLDYILSEFLSI